MNVNMKRRAVLAVGLVAALLGSTAVQAAGVKLTLWHNTADPEPILNLYKAYEAASGNTIELVPMPADGFENATLTRWTTGERPDIMEYHGTLQVLRQFNALENMRDLSDEASLKSGAPIVQSLGEVDGKRFSVTVGYPSIFGLYYNKEILSRNGLAVPTNLAELLNVCAVLKEKDPTVATVFEAGGSAWPTQILPATFLSQFNVNQAYSVGVMDRSMSVTDPDGPFIKALNGYAQLRDAGCFNSDATTAKFEDSAAALINGKAAFVAQHSGLITNFDAAAGGDAAKVDATIGFAAVGLTAPSAWFAASPLGTYYLPKTGDAAREEAALDFVHFITGAGYQQYVTDSKAPAALPGATASDMRPLMVEIDNAYKAAAPGTDIVGWANFDRLMTGLLAKQMTPEDITKQMSITIEQQSKAAGLPGW